MNSRAFDTMARLELLWREALAGSEFSEVNVFRGPVVSGDPDDAVFIGYDGDPDGTFEMVEHRQGWVGAGNRARDDVFDVHCCILAVSGVPDEAAVTAAIARQYAMFEVIAAPVWADRGSLGMGPGSVHNAPVFVASIERFRTACPLIEGVGAMPRVSFDVHVRTRV